MCITVWAEPADRLHDDASRPVGATINHITELLTCDSARREVRIRLFVLAEVDAEVPVLLHCVHRRHVTVADVVPGLLGSRDFAARITSELDLLKTEEPSGPDEVRQVALRKVNGELVEAVIDPQVPFRHDRHLGTMPEYAPYIPLTSGCFGPMSKRDTPYLFSMSVTIKGSSFDQLVAASSGRVGTFIYSITGPDVVTRDLDSLDLAAVPAYRRLYDTGIAKLRIPIGTYDVISCDTSKGGVDIRYYDRLHTAVTRYANGCVSRLGEQSVVINSWQSARPDFLIQRVATRWQDSVLG